MSAEQQLKVIKHYNSKGIKTLKPYVVLVSNPSLANTSLNMVVMESKAKETEKLSLCSMICAQDSVLFQEEM